MNRQRHILRVLSSICVGIMAFCVFFPIVFLVGAILVSEPEGSAFFSPQEGILFVISILVGLSAASYIGTRHYLSTEQSR
jgi:hypothetical protein